MAGVPPLTAPPRWADPGRQADRARQWTVAAIAADPEGACQHIRELVQSRNAWHRKHDQVDQALKVLGRTRAPT